MFQKCSMGIPYVLHFETQMTPAFTGHNKKFGTLPIQYCTNKSLRSKNFIQGISPRQFNYKTHLQKLLKKKNWLVFMGPAFAGHNKKLIKDSSYVPLHGNL